MIDSFCIVVPGCKESIESGNRLQQTDKTIQLFFGHSPKQKPDPFELFKKNNLDPKNFLANKFSKIPNAMCCFLSHFELWKRSSENKRPFLIFEHDAFPTEEFIKESIEESSKKTQIISLIDHLNKTKGLINLGKPSYGRFNQKTNKGLYPLFSKPHLPGAHAYMIHPEFAKELVKEAQKNPPDPTDVFLSKKRFPQKLFEFSPWLYEVKESFSTVQKEKGCLAKHQYKKNSYKLLL